MADVSVSIVTTKTGAAGDALVHKENSLILLKEKMLYLLLRVLTGYWKIKMQVNCLEKKQKNRKCQI